MSFSNLFPNPHRISQALDEEKAKRTIDTLLSYRRREVCATLALLWLVLLGMVFSLLVTVRAAFLVF